jgi:glycogen synthase
MVKAESDMLLEASWEVCNKVGGIWTVITSKAHQIKKFYKDRYICIGPYFPKQVIGNFEEKPVPENYKEMCRDLETQGIVLHFGKWLIEGEPNLILIDYANFRSKVNDIKKELWEEFGVDSINSDNSDYNEPVVWSYATGMLIEKLAQINSNKIVAQFHEWLAGPGLLYLKKRNVKVGTVFTTHATVMGRALASANVDLFGKAEGKKKCNLELIDIDKEAYSYHTEGKHFIEKASANNADVFTTVSEITALEAAHVLKRKVDQVLPNGLDNEKFPTFEEDSIHHRKIRDSIREFAIHYFMPYYKFDIEKALFFFLVGRYEIRNKGIDTFIQSLSMINEKLKKEKSEKTIISFIFVPTGIRGIKQSILENRTFFNDIKEGLNNEINTIHNKILYTLTAGEKLTERTVFSDTFLDEMKKRMMKFSKSGTPPLVTHDLTDNNDPIINMLIDAGLQNRAEDRVKVIVYPIYLTGADSLLDLSYYESMQGCHLGVFPSFYEPWGYTPLEAAALGVASVTTDLAGFGKYIAQNTSRKKKHSGIFVLKRMERKDHEIISDLAEFMYKFSQLSRQDRVLNKIEAKRLAGLADWKNLVENYILAHNMAIKKAC